MKLRRKDEQDRKGEKDSKTVIKGTETERRIWRGKKMKSKRTKEDLENGEREGGGRRRDTGCGRQRWLTQILSGGPGTLPDEAPHENLVSVRVPIPGDAQWKDC